MNIDWSKAPEGAEYYGGETEDFHESWYRKVGDEWYCWLLNGPNEWSLAISNLETREMIEAPESWTGTGLPPVGTVCEVQAYHIQDGYWTEVEILAQAKHDKDDALLVCELEDGERATMHGVIFREDRFRPIRTQEQIEAEEREKAIREMASEIAGYMGYDDPRNSDVGIAAYLHDHNYRKQPKEDT